ncbi:MAG: hypothetical protein ABR605_10940, partial [Desulfurivibrionaceae bacterium]
RICCVIGLLMYNQYTSQADALHLRHPVIAYRMGDWSIAYEKLFGLGQSLRQRPIMFDSFPLLIASRAIFLVVEKKFSN